jgi:hypothetical protein
LHTRPVELTDALVIPAAFSGSSGARNADTELGSQPDFPAHRVEASTALRHQRGSTRMASSGKKKTTMAKLDRERRMREKRMDKQARKDARKYASAMGLTPESDGAPTGDETARPAESEATRRSIHPEAALR